MGKGQISIDYAGGALIFFLAIIFVVTGILATIPQFTDIIEENSIELSAWSISTLLIEDEGYWESGSDSGQDWHNHRASTQSIGLATGHGLNRDKIDTLLSMDYSTVKTSFLSTGNDFNIEFTEYTVIDTSESFEKGSPPSKLSSYAPPTTTAYTNADNEIHYGSVSINSDEKFLLVTAEDNNYDSVYLSDDDWNFSDAARYTFGDNIVLDFNGRKYRLDVGNAGISVGEGRTAVLSRVIGRMGRRPPVGTQRVVEVRRFANIGDNPLKMRLAVWD